MIEWIKEKDKLIQYYSSGWLILFVHSSQMNQVMRDSFYTLQGQVLSLSLHHLGINGQSKQDIEFSVRSRILAFFSERAMSPASSPS